MESESVVVVPPRPVEQGQDYRAEAAVKASGNLGDSDETSDGVKRS